MKILSPLLSILLLGAVTAEACTIPVFRYALDRWRADDFPMMSVTHRMLACLARYPAVGDLMSLAGSRPPTQRVRVNDPDGEYHVVLPGDPGYETAEVEIEHGWVRI